MTDNSKAVLSFSIGPVQEFIIAARTLRDLAVGSRLLSYLAGRAIEAVRSRGGEFIFPAIEPGNLPESLPNTFIAKLPVSAAPAATEACRRAVLDAWNAISHSVHDRIASVFHPPTHWDAGWDDQITHFWDIRVFSIPESAGADPAVARLVGGPTSGTRDNFSTALAYLNALAAAHKQIRHYPPHEPDGRDGAPLETRPKCSLLGSLSQMGPRNPANQMAALTEFWELLRTRGIDGIRIGRSDRFCAVSLVKRFAPLDADFTRSLKGSLLRFPDIDTICAADWLDEAGLGELPQQGEWSGHWLRPQREGAVPDPDEPPCPPHIAEIIQSARRKLGAPPAYYAILMLDGDSMGDRLRNRPPAEIRQISQQLARYAGEIVPDIVCKHRGTLVYAGGDDVLALLPTARAISCARELAEEFQRLPMPGGKATASAGLAIAHYKENLRLALETARAAEAASKSRGRNRLSLAILGRAGNAAPLTLPWDRVPLLEDLHRDFKNPEGGDVTDRWAYHFRAFLDAIGDNGPSPAEPGAARDIRKAELHRLLARSRKMPPDFRSHILLYWDALSGDPAHSDASRDFIDGILSVSFLTRSPKE